jgi:RNA polymerase sigma-70 factor (ECF subfamily)
MSRPLDSPTHVTLLERLARSGTLDQAAWSEFVDQYGPRIYRWCLRWKLQPADAEDVTQSVLLKLAAHMKKFAYDPTRSFRAWLKKVSYNAWKDFMDDRAAAVQGSGSGQEEWWREVEAREELARELEEQFDQELLERAMQVVRLRVAPHNWQAFCLTAIEGVAATEVAEQLQMKVARVYAARSAIQQKLKEECQKLEGLPPP